VQPLQGDTIPYARKTFLQTGQARKRKYQFLILWDWTWAEVKLTVVDNGAKTLYIMLFVAKSGHDRFNKKAPNSF